MLYRKKINHGKFKRMCTNTYLYSAFHTGEENIFEDEDCQKDDHKKWKNTEEFHEAKCAEKQPSFLVNGSCF